jgi:hypothetical protein
VAAAITQLGHSPGDLDMIAYFNRETLTPSEMLERLSRRTPVELGEPIEDAVRAEREQR